MIALVHLVRDLLAFVHLIAPSTFIENLLNLPPALAYSGIWFQFAIVYFFVIGPIGVLILLIWQFLIRNRPTHWTRPPAISWRDQKLAVVLTAYNDEASIGSAVDEFRFLPQVGVVIVVDNNCKDRTVEIAMAHGATVVPEKRQGYGFACMGGLQYALDHTDADAIVLCEGDQTFYGEDLSKFLSYIGDCDLVVGTRNTRALTKEGSQMDWFMAWGNLFLAILIRLRYWDWSVLRPSPTDRRRLHLSGDTPHLSRTNYRPIEGRESPLLPPHDLGRPPELLGSRGGSHQVQRACRGLEGCGRESIPSRSGRVNHAGLHRNPLVPGGF